MICKRCGGIKINGVEWMWDYNKDMPVRVDEMQNRAREIKESKKALEDRMHNCKCGSYAINPNHHGRDGTDLDLCDVCYWRKRAEDLKIALCQQTWTCSKCGDETNNY